MAPRYQELYVFDRFGRRSLANSLECHLRSIAVMDTVMTPLKNVGHSFLELLYGFFPRVSFRGGVWKCSVVRL